MKKTFTTIFIIIMISIPVFTSATVKPLEKKPPEIVERVEPDDDLKEAPVVLVEEDSKTVELKKANPEEVVEVQPEPEQKPEPQIVPENIEEEPQEAAHSSLPYIYIAVGVLAVLLGAILVIKKKRNSR